ncbi:MAG: DNA-directed RNA polymerase subunit alpha C-terminal domain-containing protein [Clostridia bacterium]|nr:DNA-directed RNA polymerase subunit alpha C-terminal domain-containing protein [Clostridia bacterium]
MEDKIKEQSIDRLDISCKTIEKLKENKITIIKQLARKSKTDLKNIGLTANEYNKVEVEMELLGLCLKNSL